MPKEGMLLQVDGSDHDWLEGRGPKLVLIGAVDDATGELVHAVFREHEDAQGYLTLLRETVRKRGIPVAWYSDRHGIFRRNGKEAWTLTDWPGAVSRRRSPAPWRRWASPSSSLTHRRPRAAWSAAGERCRTVS